MKNRSIWIVIIAITVSATTWLLKSSPSEETFSLQDYKDQIQQSSMTNGAIPNAETAKKVAEVILNEIYGADQISERKPLVAKFDDQSKVWLVQGTLPENILGGVPNILLQQADGKVLAVWHEK